MRLHTASGEIVIEIPKTAKKIAVLHSATTDSTLLLYCILKEIDATGADTEVLVLQKGGEPTAYNCALVKACNPLFLKPKTEILPRVGTSHESLRAVLTTYVRRPDIDMLYTSAIDNPPLSAKILGTPPVKSAKESEKVRLPFHKMNRADVIKTYYDLGIQDMLKFTRTCGDYPYSVCNRCFFCNERKWAFKTVGQVDPFAQPDFATLDYFRQVL